MTNKINVLWIIAIAASVALWHAPPARAGENEDLQFAIGAYNDGFYDVAEKGFADFAEKYRFSDNRAYSLYLLGVSRFALKKYDGAKKTLTELVELYPKYERLSSAHYFLGEAAYVTDDNKTARKSYKYVYKNTPADIPRDTVLFRVGELDFLAGDYSGSKESLGELMNSSSDYEHMDIVRFYFAFSCYYTKDYKTALSEFELVLKKQELIKDTLPDVYFSAAESAFATGRYGDSATYYLKFLEKTKNDKRRESARYFYAMSLYFTKNVEGALKQLKRYDSDYPKGEYIQSVVEQLAQIYFDVKNYGEAKGYYVRLIEKYPKSKDFSDWQLKSAWCLTNLNEYGAAAEIYEKVEAATKDESAKKEIMYLRAESYFVIKEYYKALELYDKLKDENKYKKEVNLRLADCHFYLNDYVMSRKYYAEYLKTNSAGGNSRIYLNYAVSLQDKTLPGDLRKGEPPPGIKEALTYYEKVISGGKVDDFYRTALYNAAILYDALGDTGNMKRVMEKYVNIKDVKAPSYFYLRLANLFYDEGDGKNAVKYYERAIKTNEQDVMGESLFRLGEIYYNEGDLTKSLEYFDLAESAFQNENNVKQKGLVYMKRANIYERMKKWGKARDEYVKVTQAGGDEELAKIAESRIIEIEKQIRAKADGMKGDTGN